jgi:ABC-2 type transport system permease protein
MSAAFVALLLRDLIFVAVLALLVAPLCVKMRATYAVLKRNFIGYFSNPTGYVFLSCFVLLTSIAAFCPHEFFNNNLANLDQLNKYLPYIMLVFIPAITMSVWADERRQGTDELLLTLPAADFDIVVGKYLAAGSIFTTSLLFSQLCNFAVLASLTLGDLDTGLFFATYFGYWLVGMAMLSVGMVASFLTGNLTISFILGAVLNAPLVFAAHADLIPSSALSRLVGGHSLASQFDDFGRGVLSLSSTVYFVMVVVVGLYMSMVLIGSRHWSGGRDGTSMLGHFLVRTVALIAMVFCVNYIFTNQSGLSALRRDLTVGKVGSLSPDTQRLLRELKSEHPINIEAFVSDQTPAVYAKTKADLLSLLKEFRASAASKVNVQIHLMDQTREESVQAAAMAEERFGIKPTPVRTRSRGTIKDEELFLSAAFTCGLEKVIVPFFDYGVPVEYELVRSISTVARKARKTLGVVRTDAQLFGGFTFAGGRPQQMPKQLIVEELEKQYDVKEVDPTNRIEPGTYDVLIVVQPSSLGPQEFDNVVDAIRNGQPTAVFEDPRPIFLVSAPATGEPKRPPGGGMMGMFGGGGGGPQPKGDIQKLWNVLGLTVRGQSGMMGTFEPDLAWQRFNPYKKLQIQGIPDSWVFCRRDAPGGQNSVNDESPITSGLDEVFFPVPGVIEPSKDSELKFTKLVSTGEFAGTIPFQKFMENQETPALLQFAQGAPKGPQVIAARIQGKLPNNKEMSDAGYQVALAEKKNDAKPADAKPAKADDDRAGHDHAKPAEAKPVEAKPAEAKPAEAKPAEAKPAEAKPAEAKPAEGAAKETAAAESKKREIDVVYVADIDLMISAFLRIRARPGEDEEISWNFENVNFLLNIVDSLAGDTDYIGIRKRKPYHGTLRMVEAWVQGFQKEEADQRRTFQQDFDTAIKEAENQNKQEIEKFEKKLKDLQDKQRQEGHTGIKLGELQKALQELEAKRALLERQLSVKREQLKHKRDENVARIQRGIDREIRGIQFWCKFWAVVLPLIPPLLVGLVVFVQRRLREREGVAKARMR